MRFRLLSSITALLLLIAVGGPILAVEVAPDVAAENAAPRVERFRVRIVNDTGGEIAVSRDQGRTWQPLGTVTRWTDRVNRKGFQASRYGHIGAVVATAVNAIHIKADQDTASGYGVIFSLLPAEFAGPPQAGMTILDPAASIYTSTPAGTGIFGGGEAPLVGSAVLVERDGQLGPMAAGYVPRRGDSLQIVVEQPTPYPSQLIFENQFGGLITLVYPDGERKIVGQVLRPVVGVGRFEGTKFSGVGRIRANHPGVIDLDLSPVLETGGIQIVPREHANTDPVLRTMAWTRTQWMVVGPVCATDPSWEGVAPLFYQFIRPDYRPDDLYAADWETRLLDRFLVETKTATGEWGPPPTFSLDPDMSKPLAPFADTALKDVAAIRILFPLPPASE